MSILSTTQRSAQAAIQNEINNISNVNTEGFTQKKITYTTQVLGNVGHGLTLPKWSRAVDEAKVESFRTQTSAVQKSETLKAHHDYMQQRLGSIDSPKGLHKLIQNFSSKVDVLLHAPESQSSNQRLQVILAAQDLCREMNDLSQEFQTLRQDADSRIAEHITHINGLLQTLERNNSAVSHAMGTGTSPEALFDAQDRTVLELSQYIDITTRRNDRGAIEIYGASGMPLLVGSTRALTYAPAPTLDAQTTYPSEIGAIMIDGNPLTDLTPRVIGGKMAGDIEIRDTLLVNAQENLDTLAEKLKTEVNKIHNQGSTPRGLSTLTGTRTFPDPTTDAFSGSGEIRIAVIDQTTGKFINAQKIDLSAYTTLEDLRAALDATPGLTATFTAKGALQLSADNIGEGLAITSLSTPEAQETTTGRGFSHYFGLQDFFVTDTPANDIYAGLAGEIKIRGEISADPKRIATATLDRTDPITGPLTEFTALHEGDNTNILKLSQKLHERLNFGDAGSMSAQTKSLSGYAESFIAHQAQEAYRNANETSELQEGSRLQKEILDSISGVNIMESMMVIMEWNKVFTAATQLSKVQREMDKQLMGMMG